MFLYHFHSYRLTRYFVQGVGADDPLLFAHLVSLDLILCANQENTRDTRNSALSVLWDVRWTDN